MDSQVTHVESRNQHHVVRVLGSVKVEDTKNIVPVKEGSVPFPKNICKR